MSPHYFFSESSILIIQLPHKLRQRHPDAMTELRRDGNRRIGDTALQLADVFAIQPALTSEAVFAQAHTLTYNGTDTLFTAEDDRLSAEGWCPVAPGGNELPSPTPSSPRAAVREGLHTACEQ